MKRFAVLLAPCILSPGLQASQKSGRHWGYPFLLLLIKYGVDIFPLPCAESTFGGLDVGLCRKPHGIKYYETFDGYMEHCNELAEHVVTQLIQMRISGYQFLCILGVENSPSCAAKHIYSNRGTLKQKGIFFQLLEEKLVCNNFKIPFIGILRRQNSPAAYAQLEEILKFFESSQKDDNL